MTILGDIIDYKKQEIATAKANAPLSSLAALAAEAGPARGFANALERAALDGFALIAEIKKASPSKGLIREDFQPAALARAYENGGAACLSVLTDGPSFQGSRAHLQQARAACSLPVLRKDFMIDPYQIAEAKAWGADCVLLIMACLDIVQATELEAAAQSHGIDVLVECHDANDLDKALALRTKLIGVNNRNLKTFSTSLAVTYKLATHIPRDRFLVSESGIRHHADILNLSANGAKAFLVGEHLMRETDVAGATRRLLTGETPDTA